MIELSNKWIDIIINKPEAGMGYHIITVTLNDGTQYKQCVVEDGKITRIKGYKTIPFSLNDIKEVIVTNDKWDFDKE